MTLTFALSAAVAHECTGRWRRRQLYALPGPAGLVGNDQRLPSERTPCEWRTGVPR